MSETLAAVLALTVDSLSKILGQTFTFTAIITGGAPNITTISMIIKYRTVGTTPWIDAATNYVDTDANGYAKTTFPIEASVLGNFEIIVRAQKGTAYQDSNILTVSVVQKGGCFIATAAYGTPFAKEINVLRSFRDNFMLLTKFGRGLVSSYYKVSPTIARSIEKHEKLKWLIRTLLNPIVRWLKQQ